MGDPFFSNYGLCFFEVKRQGNVGKGRNPITYTKCVSTSSIQKSSPFIFSGYRNSCASRRLKSVTLDTGLQKETL